MIRNARLSKKLTQKQLASMLGISFQQIQKLETPGKSNPTYKTLCAISDALDEQIDLKLVA
jgi:transcriptional regulator with XRE-family HTH domain